MIAHIRIVLDHKEDVFRDIEISLDANLEELHKIILDAFMLSTEEMASFYLTNEEWEQGEEIPLVSMQEGTHEMADMTVSSIFREPGSRLLYVQDFLIMWRFMVELEELKEDASQEELPFVILSFGDMPHKAPSVQFVSEADDSNDPYGDVLDEFNEFEEFDEFGEY
ncbi:MAG: hypothetical protein H8D62_00450 [Bacteroidetes bacterium]|nr:hypothetical protein [Bacteroidota bacterium]